MVTPKPVSQLNHASHRACFGATASTPLSNLWNSKTFADLTFCCWKLERRHMERTLPKIWICLSFFHKSIVAVHILDPFMIQYCNYMCFENTYIQTNHPFTLCKSRIPFPESRAEVLLFKCRRSVIWRSTLINRRPIFCHRCSILKRSGSSLIFRNLRINSAGKGEPTKAT